MVPFLFDHPAALAGLIFVLGGLIALRLRSNRSLPYPLPPSPPGDPVIGHLRKIPALNPEHKYIQWGKQYGRWELLSNFTVSLSHAA